MKIVWKYTVPCAKQFDKRSKKQNIRKTTYQLFEFREKRRNITDILLLFREKNNIQMVTQRQLNSLKRRLNAATKEVADT